MTSNETEKCPYCQTDLEENNESTSRTQHNHRCNVSNGHECPSCGYQSWTESKVMDRGGRIKQIDSTQTFEKIPSGGVAVVRSEDGFIQNSHVVEDSDELEDVIKRANEYRQRKGFDAFYFITGSTVGSTEIRIDADSNTYEGDKDTSEIADYKVSDSGFEKLRD